MSSIILHVLLSAVALLLYRCFLYQKRSASTSISVEDLADYPGSPTKSNGPSAEKLIRAEPFEAAGQKQNDGRSPPFIALIEPDAPNGTNATPESHSRTFASNFTEHLSPVLVATPGSVASSTSEEYSDGDTPLTPPTTRKKFVNNRSYQTQHSPLRNKGAHTSATGSSSQCLVDEEEDDGGDAKVERASYFPEVIPEAKKLFSGKRTVSRSKDAHDDRIVANEQLPQHAATETHNASLRENEVDIFQTVGKPTSSAFEIEAEQQDNLPNKSEQPAAEPVLLNPKSPTRNIVLDGILPYALLQKLEGDLTVCVASTIRGPLNARCTNKPHHIPLAKVSLKDAAFMLSGPQRYIAQRRFDEFIRAITSLLPFTLCKAHYTAAIGPDRLGTLKEFLKQWSGMQSGSPKLGLSAISAAEFSQWVKAILRPGNFELGPTSDADATVASQLPTLGFIFGRTDSCPISYFSPWQPRDRERKSPREAIQEVAWELLKPTELDPGYIYVFGHYSEPSIRKIGYTTKSLSARLKAWNTQCNRTHCYDRSTWEHEVPHAKRVEKLIHTELKAMRREISCSTCKTRNERRNHREWFEGEVAHFERVIKKWVAWIQEEPYELSFTQRWKLKDIALQGLQEVCEPLDLCDPIQDTLSMLNTSSSPDPESSTQDTCVDQQDSNFELESEAPIRPESLTSPSMQGPSIDPIMAKTSKSLALNGQRHDQVEPARTEDSTAEMHPVSHRLQSRYHFRPGRKRDKYKLK